MDQAFVIDFESFSGWFSSKSKGITVFGAMVIGPDFAARYEKEEDREKRKREISFNCIFD